VARQALVQLTESVGVSGASGVGCHPGRLSQPNRAAAAVMDEPGLSALAGAEIHRRCGQRGVLTGRYLLCPGEGTALHRAAYSAQNASSWQAHACEPPHRRRVRSGGSAHRIGFQRLRTLDDR